MRHARALSALAALAIAGAFILFDPTGLFHPPALLLLGRGLLPACLALVAAMGGGGAVLRALAPDALDADAGWLSALAVGIGLQGLVLFPLAAAGVLTPILAGAVFLAFAMGWVARPGISLPRPSPAVCLVGFLLLLPGLFEALAPPTDTDELSYQLALPRHIAETGGMWGGFAHHDGSRPLPVHLIFAALYALGGEVAPRLWHLLVCAALALGVRTLAEARFGRGQGDLPALVLLGSWSWLREAGLASNDHVVALWLLVAADAVLARRFVLMGWMCGFAFAAKYTAAPVVAGLALVAAWDGLRGPDSRRGAARVTLAAIATFVPVLPWWGRNLADGLHPLFPFAGWPDASDFAFVYPEKYGAGRDLASTLLLPWNLLFRAQPDSFVFLGRVSLLWAAIGAAALVGAWRDTAVRRLVFVVAVGFVGWAIGAQILRYLLPLSAIAALAGGALPRAWPAWLLLLLSLPANLAPALERATSQAAVVTGREDRESYLARELSSWGAVKFLRDHVPADSPVALLFAWQGYYVEQPWTLGSVEDHVPTRYWLWRYGDGSLGALAAEGVRYVLVGDVHFLKKSYPFLAPDVLKAQFTDPEELLRTLLLRDATLLFEEGRWEVWRLDVQAGHLDAPVAAP